MQNDTLRNFHLHIHTDTQTAGSGKTKQEQDSMVHYRGIYSTVYCF